MLYNIAMSLDIIGKGQSLESMDIIGSGQSLVSVDIIGNVKSLVSVDIPFQMCRCDT